MEITSAGASPIDQESLATTSAIDYSTRLGVFGSGSNTPDQMHLLDFLSSHGIQRPYKGHLMQKIQHSQTCLKQLYKELSLFVSKIDLPDPEDLDIPACKATFLDFLIRLLHILTNVTEGLSAGLKRAVLLHLQAPRTLKRIIDEVRFVISDRCLNIGSSSSENQTYTDEDDSQSNTSTQEDTDHE